MHLDPIDLSHLIAIGHDPEKLALLIDRGDTYEYREISAPTAAYHGLQQVAALVNEGHPLLEETKPLPMCPVYSACTSAIGYDPQQEVLQVKFANGSIYQYDGVAAETWQAFHRAESLGTFYNQKIKGTYSARRIS